MNYFIIEKYIKKLTKQDIINYLNTQNITIPQKEINIIYDYIKNKYKDYIKGNKEQLLKEIKTKVSPTTYQIIENYHNQYKNKI